MSSFHKFPYTWQLLRYDIRTHQLKIGLDIKLALQASYNDSVAANKKVSQKKEKKCVIQCGNLRWSVGHLNHALSCN